MMMMIKFGMSLCFMKARSGRIWREKAANRRATAGGGVAARLRAKRVTVVKTNSGARRDVESRRNRMIVGR